MPIAGIASATSRDNLDKLPSSVFHARWLDAKPCDKRHNRIVWQESAKNERKSDNSRADRRNFFRPNVQNVDSDDPRTAAEKKPSDRIGVTLEILFFVFDALATAGTGLGEPVGLSR